jgi:hypothetical protein
MSLGDSFLFGKGLFRLVETGLVTVFLAGAWVLMEAPSACAAVGMALIYSRIVVVGRPAATFRDSFVCVLVNSMLVSMLVVGLGRIESTFTPLYFLAALRSSQVIVRPPLRLCCS